MERPKEYYLREQLKAIQRNWEKDEGSRSRRTKEKIEEANLPKVVEEKALKEVDRLENASHGC